MTGLIGYLTNELQMTDSNGMTALMHNANQHEELLADVLLVEQGMKSIEGYTALIYAIIGKHLQIVKRLTAEYEVCDNDQNPPILHAIRHRFEEGALLLLPTVPRCYFTGLAKTLAMWAAEYDMPLLLQSLPTVELLYSDERGDTALNWAVRGRSLRCIKYLFPILSSIRNLLGETALMHAASTGYVEGAQWLLGTSLGGARDNKEELASHKAYQHHQLECLRAISGELTYLNILNNPQDMDLICKLRRSALLRALCCIYCFSERGDSRIWPCTTTADDVLYELDVHFAGKAAPFGTFVNILIEHVLDTLLLPHEAITVDHVHIPDHILAFCDIPYPEAPCYRCTTEASTRVLLPCAHLCACTACYSTLFQVCPLCRRPFTGSMEVLPE
ncbi:Ankyrin repeat protein 2 [Giardia muris]|uniref:Ankyrin repeat protein 2 n=1 Tax=Giardia muris TaxID=5742 RepID=A0A4Z1SQ04_GIAMU|nr:Ankyrin repeat protein 2 [Giardia muris]|eukprot:TNJ27914.1 Ankyrin repeat protein 2 [Giardia muris]